MNVLEAFDDAIDALVSEYQTKANPDPAKKHRKARAAVAELIEAAERADKLLHLLTVRQVIEAGYDAIDASGLNPYCMNEGLAEGHESIAPWWLASAIRRCKGEQA